MERDGICLPGDDSQSESPLLLQNTSFSSKLLLENVGEVVLTLDSNGLSWRPNDISDDDGSSCLRAKLTSDSQDVMKFSEIYAIQFTGWGPMHESALAGAGDCFLGHASEMYRFSLHGIKKSKTHPSLWSPSTYSFGHSDVQICQAWVSRVDASLKTEADRPKKLLVFVHPRSGKGDGRRTWEVVDPIFRLASVNTKVIITERARHAFDVVASIANKELSSYDGVVAVGGDGLFNEILNGLLLSRHKVSQPSGTADFDISVRNSCSTLDHGAGENITDAFDASPLLESSRQNESGGSTLRSADGLSGREHDSEFFFPHERFRFGVIPAGSTDAVVICTTGARDPITSALHIVLGKRVSLDIAQVVRWKLTASSKDEPYVRYAATFAGYGFYGDVITESEKYRWMGPKRYDFAGTKVFLEHRSYEAEVAYLEAEPEKASSSRERGSWIHRVKTLSVLPKQSNRVACRARCSVCNRKTINMSRLPGGASYKPRWLRTKGRFLSVGAAVISCRNERAPDGLVADAHLSDGFLHLILVKECPRPHYLWHLTQIAKRGGNPLDFEFVEHHKTTAFTFTSFGKESMWNVDGELLQAHKLSAQVFRGLVSVFASGPEV